MQSISTTTPKPGSSRVLSVDVLRGLTIALMILVNDPGDWAHTYKQLDHAPWNGFTLTDLVFPNFLFLVGMATVFSLQSRVARGDCRKTLAGHIVRRAALIFALKMFLTAFPYFHYTHFRIYGVLTRIALCYLAAGLICLGTLRARTLLGIAAALLVGYWVLMRYVPVPGMGGGYDAIPTHAFAILDPDRNLAAWLDRAVSALTLRTIHTGTLYEHTRDPEGLLSTLPAVATTLIGCVTALWLRRVGRPRGITPMRCVAGLGLAGLAGLAGGLAWNPWFPINKNLWTGSYVLFAAGLSLVLLAVCYWLVDVRRLGETVWGERLLWPWLVFGSNAITAFAVSNLLVKIMLWVKVADDAKPVAAWLWVYRHGFARGHSTEVTSLAFALAFTVVCFLPNWVLYRRGIFLKL